MRGTLWLGGRAAYPVTLYEWTLVNSDVVYKQLYYVVRTLLLDMTKEFRFGTVSMDFAMDQVLCY